MISALYGGVFAFICLGPRGQVAAARRRPRVSWPTATGRTNRENRTTGRQSNGGKDTAPFSRVERFLRNCRSPAAGRPGHPPPAPWGDLRAGKEPPSA